MRPAGYRNTNTRTAYLQRLHRWFEWCTARTLDPLEVERNHVELDLRWFERQVDSINTVCHCLSVHASFYHWLVQTGLFDPTPIASVRRHAVPIVCQPGLVCPQAIQAASTSRARGGRLRDDW